MTRGAVSETQVPEEGAELRGLLEGQKEGGMLYITMLNKYLALAADLRQTAFGADS